MSSSFLNVPLLPNSPLRSCPRQTPCVQNPPLLCCSTRPAPRNLTEAHTSRRSSTFQGTWAAGRTIMLRRTSKRVNEVVDNMRLPAVVRLSRCFWGDARNGTDAEKLPFVMRQPRFTVATARYRILLALLALFALGNSRNT